LPIVIAGEYHRKSPAELKQVLLLALQLGVVIINFIRQSDNLIFVKTLAIYSIKQSVHVKMADELVNQVHLFQMGVPYLR
jgi:hypothetical protein